MSVLDRLLRRAQRADAKRDPYGCIVYLMEALRIEPENSKAIYLLAVQHAEIGLVELSISGLSKLMKVEPAFELARLQLGLLMLDRGWPADARSQFAALKASSDGPMRAFSDAMVLAVDGRIDAASEAIKSGLAMSTTSSARHLLMRGILWRLGKTRSAATQEPGVAKNSSGRRPPFRAGDDSF